MKNKLHVTVNIILNPPSLLRSLSKSPPPPPSLYQAPLQKVMKRKRSPGCNDLCSILKCAVPENIHTHPMEGQWKFRGGGQNFKRKVWDLSRNSRGVVGGGGFKPKNLPWEGYGYFLEQHNVICHLISLMSLMSLISNYHSI